MAEKSKPGHEAKKTGKSLKEKRAAKNAKQSAQALVRKSWDK